jgi:hypothetical protein
VVLSAQLLAIAELQAEHYVTNALQRASILYCGAMVSCTEANNLPGRDCKQQPVSVTILMIQ